MGNRFFAEDTVALKKDPSIIAVVEATWRDLDDIGASRPDDWIYHSLVSAKKFSEYLREGKPPVDHVVIQFMDPCAGTTLIKESDLILKDRGLVIGDVVKRNPNDVESGYVLGCHMKCLLQPVYTQLPWTQSSSWPHQPQDNRLFIPCEELCFEDWQEGDYVMYKGWIGEVSDIHQQITIKLDDGSVVRVAESDDVEVVVYVPDGHEGQTQKSDLIRLLNKGREALNDISGSRETAPADFFYPGQMVFTKKSNLRLGNWVIGSYNPSIPPKGIVVEVRVTELSVDWLSANVFETNPNRRSSHMPPEVLTTDEFPDLKLYNRNNSSGNMLGSNHGSDFTVGDFCRFRDTAGAAVKYSEGSQLAAEAGVFRRIPRIDTLGFDMNSFDIKGTVQTVKVQWQGGAISELPATELIPYLNVDDHDLWIGEICSFKAAEVTENGIVQLGKIGVVQSVDARERIANVKWFIDSHISMFEEQSSILEAGSKLGTLSGVEEQVSVYEVMAYPALNRRRGDLVVIAPSEEMLALSHTSSITQAFGESQPTHTGLANPNNWDASMTASTGTQPELRWFGEVVDLGKDGLLTVRLGGLDKVEDIKVPVTRVSVVVGGDDNDTGPGAGDGFYDADSTDDDEMDFTDDDEMDFEDDEEEIIEEVITYEGGERMDNGDSDDWTDEDEELEDASDERNAVTNNDVEMSDATPIQPVTNVPRTSKIPKPALRSDPDYDFSSYQDMPDQFEILSSPPPQSNPFLNSQTILSASLLRRIRHEHTILSSSLPAGIWVRTYEDRLDLLRVLIVGPRGTPYELAPFVLDFHLDEAFPNAPPKVHFHSWTYAVGRINPNLYEDGKVCLSILGTWPDSGEGEGWSREGSSILQVIVSLMGLVLVQEPYYNEAGFEALVGTEDSMLSSKIYTEKAYCMSKGFIAYALRNDVQGLEEVVHWLYTDKRGPQLLKQAVQESHTKLAQGNSGDGNEDRLSAGAAVLLKRYLKSLEEKLAELEP